MKIDWEEVNEIVANEGIADEDWAQIVEMDLWMQQVSIRDDLKPFFIKAQNNLEVLILEGYGVVK